MPFYEYQCQNCDYQFEELQGMNDAPLRKCPECQKLTLQKLVSASAFHLKGDGWYVTDFKDKKVKTDKTDKVDKKPSETTTSALDPAS